MWAENNDDDDDAVTVIRPGPVSQTQLLLLIKWNKTYNQWLYSNINFDFYWRTRVSTRWSHDFITNPAYVATMKPRLPSQGSPSDWSNAPNLLPLALASHRHTEMVAERAEPKTGRRSWTEKSLVFSPPFHFPETFYSASSSQVKRRERSRRRIPNLRRWAPDLFVSVTFAAAHQRSPDCFTKVIWESFKFTIYIFVRSCDSDVTV